MLEVCVCCSFKSVFGNAVLLLWFPEVYLIETLPTPDQLQSEPDTGVLPRPDGWRVRLVHVVQRLRRPLERVVQGHEVVDRVIVVGDEEAPGDKMVRLYTEMK